MKNSSVYSKKDRRGYFSHTIHHEEVLPGTKVKNDGLPAKNQKLSDHYGTNFAEESLSSRQHKRS